MCEQMNNSETALIEDKVFQMMKENGAFELKSCIDSFDFEDKRRFTKLELNTAQKMHVSALMQQVPSAVAAGTMAQAYIVSFPQGLPHTLTALNQGGYGSMIRENGKFVGSASFYSMLPQAAVLAAFTAMSVVTGQYFLAQINSEMKMMNLKLDKILEFLYGDKKAELMSEISFIKYAYQNYSSIMSHEQQRAATIISLQAAKKVAMKDIEFYLGDLDSTVNYEAKNYYGFDSLINKAFQIGESLQVSLQLYSLSSLLEVYYAQNHDTDYIKYLEIDMTSYIDKCDKRMLSSFSVLNRRLSEFKVKTAEKNGKLSYEMKIGELIESLNGGEESAMRKSLRSALHASTEKAEYYINNAGDVYIKAS